MAEASLSRKTAELPADFPTLTVDRFLPANRRRLSGPALRTFNAIADLWTLDESQRRAILGFPSRSTYQNWMKTAREHRDVTLDVDVLTRLSAILGIYKALRILFGSEQDGIAWLCGPHKALVFGGRPPRDLLTAGSQDALLSVRRFLDAARGGLYMEPNALDQDFEPYTDADVRFS